MNFYDTNSFIKRIRRPLNNEQIMISSITMDYLTELKINIPKDFEENVNVLEYQNFMFEEFEEQTNKNAHRPGHRIIWIPSNEIKDLTVAYACDSYLYPDETIYISDDIKMRSYANSVLGNDSIKSYEEDW